ncbi:Rid family hydrolase [Paraburkholderia bannensis]|uniref:Rid family hydrolase n=1 Tax=Paraburkholderia bannensis TaxID=765414 RepID=UPI002AB679E7|nr:Rid family hydrolase [Paraburkholderia bannensis]
MSTKNFRVHAPGPYGAKQASEFNYSQIFEAGGRVEMSGQGGYHPETLDYPPGVTIEQEVARAFDNVTFMLGAIGLDWSNVAHVNTFHRPEPDGYILAATAEVVKQFASRMPHHKPTWTALGVAVLGDPGMRVEISVVAFR